MGQDSYRVMHKFWLDVAKSDQHALAQELALRKQERRYSAAIRDGLRLLFTLEQGNTDELERQFPGIVQLLQQHPPDGNGGNGGGDVLERIEQLLQQNGTSSRIETTGLDLPPITERSVIETTAAVKPTSEELGVAFMEDRGALFE